MKWLYLIISFFIVSCSVSEEESMVINYRPSLFLHHHFLDETNKDIVDDVVTSTTYFVYHSNGECLKTDHDRGTENFKFVATNNSLLIDSVLYGVPEDTYTIVACGNLSVATPTLQTKDLSKISIASLSKCTGTENLFMSIKEYDVAREKDTITSRDIYFDNCAIHVTMEVKSDEGGIDDFEVYLSDVPAGYDFKGNLLSETANIYPVFKKESDYLKTADFYIYRLSSDGGSTNIKINNPSQTIPPVLISDYLKYSGETLDPSKREEMLKIVVDVSPIGVTIKINDWVVGSIQEEDNL